MPDIVELPEGYDFVMYHEGKRKNPKMADFLVHVVQYCRENGIRCYLTLSPKAITETHKAIDELSASTKTSNGS
jgi:hypothetical protein